MEQQSNYFDNLKDFNTSNMKALASITLKLKNFNFDNKQLGDLNSCLKKCTMLESLTLDFEQDSISDDQMNEFFNEYSYLINYIPNFDNISNYQKYSYIQFLRQCQEEEELPIELKGNNEIRIFGDFLQDDAINSLINLNKLELSLRDQKDFIEDEYYCSLAESLCKFVQLNTLELCLINYEKFLKSMKLINCRNIKILNLQMPEDLPESTQAKYKALALKIKRLIKFSIIN
ncbi:hypothetical protein ABPG73_022774 [Tetrahymena malaccensis]